MLHLDRYSPKSFALKPPSDVCLHDGDHSDHFFGDYQFVPFPEHLENFYVWSNSFNFIVEFINFKCTRL